MVEGEWRTTSTIIERLREFDDRSTWDLVADHFREPVVRLGLRLGLTPQDAQDAAQETLIAFADSMRRGKFDSSKGRLKNWLFGIAHRQAQRTRAATSRQRAKTVVLPDTSSVADVVFQQSDPAERVWEEEWRAAVYKRALDQLRVEVKQRTFDIFCMSVIDGQPVSAVQERFGVSDTLVYNTRQRLAQRVKQLLDEYEDV